jgi:Rad3-related DNA helicase
MTPAYSAAEVLTFIAAIGVLLTGLGAVIVNIIVALKQGHKLEDVAHKAESISHQVQEVHTLTNSNLSAVKAELATATAQIVALRELVQDLKAEREKASMATALATTIVPAALPSAAQSLDHIDANTAATVAAVHSLAKPEIVS